MATDRKKFTDEEIKYILDNWGKISVHQMKKDLNCSWETVCRVAEKHGKSRPQSNSWTDEEVEKLKVLSEKLHYKEIAVIMQKTDNAIYLKARKLGITLIQDRRKWTSLEEEQLKELWGNKTLEYITRKLRRTTYSVIVKANRLKLGPMIRNNSELLTISDVMDILNVTRDRITITWVKLGLELKLHPVSKHRAYYTITLEKLLEFLENNQNEWDSRKVEEYSLGCEPPWLIEKRKRDRIENPLWYRRWTTEEINQAIFLFRCKKNFQEIADELDRTPEAIAYLLRNQGYSYRLPQFWNGNELKFLKDNYDNMTSKEIANEIGRTPDAVQAKIEQLGYKRTRKKKNI